MEEEDYVVLVDSKSIWSKKYEERIWIREMSADEFFEEVNFSYDKNNCNNFI